MQKRWPSCPTVPPWWRSSGGTGFCAIPPVRIPVRAGRVRSSAADGPRCGAVQWRCRNSRPYWRRRPASPDRETATRQRRVGWLGYAEGALAARRPRAHRRVPADRRYGAARRRHRSAGAALQPGDRRFGAHRAGPPQRRHGGQDDPRQGTAAPYAIHDGRQFRRNLGRRGPDGKTVLYILSDDNFNPQQRTLLLMFAMP